MIGIDIVNIKKFTSKSHINEVFTQNEISYANSKKIPSQTLAGIFAAKEALVKAYGLNLSYIIAKRIEIKHEGNILKAYLDGKFLTKNLSISHDCDYAVAICTKDTNILNINPDFINVLPERIKSSHKGDYGKIAFLGGSKGMAGSIYLASSAALRSGAGLVYAIVPDSISNILQIKATEQIVLNLESENIVYTKSNINKINSYLIDKDVLVIGPGIGRDSTLNFLINSIFLNYGGKILVDADGLNAVSLNPEILKTHENLVLTPHLKEFSRLSKLSIDEIKADRVNIAKDFAKKYKLILVLKSEETLVTDGNRIYINKIGNPGMATAGSGDVLSGVIAALLHRLDPYKASCLGVYLHSLAGDLARDEIGEESLIASDIIKYLSKAIKLLR